MTDPLLAERRETARRLKADRWRAHEVLFPHRHPDASSAAHRELVEAINRPIPRLSIEAFRGFGKTTYLEETAVLKAAFQEFHNLVIVGASSARAIERLDAIANEFDINERLISVFGRLKGQPWTAEKKVLVNGVCLQALGRGESIAGMKYMEWRPDAFLVDDIEDPKEPLTDPERGAMWIWFQRTFFPSLDRPRQSWGRFLGTRRGKGSLAERLEAAKVPVVRFPAEYMEEEAGERRATWPAKFPLSEIDAMRNEPGSDIQVFNEEYMCLAQSDATRVFPTIPVRPRVRSWEPVYAMYDPARTTGRASSVTGKVVWSWLSRPMRLVFWKSSGERWLPDQIIDDIFKTNEEFGPVWIGVEEDGLNEWIKQPLRHEALKRMQWPPLRPVFAPRDKLRFIERLQPFAKSGEIEFAEEMPDFQAQLLSFPHGLKDIPNAAAYALEMRPGAPIYDGFGAEHVAESVLVDRQSPVWLACNATRGLVTAVAMQLAGGRVRLLADWAVEEEPSVAVPMIVRDVGMRFRVAPTACLGGEHFDRYRNVGLGAALRAVPLEVERGTAPDKGRDALRAEFARLVRGEAAVRVSLMARHTLNALGGGYCRSLKGVSLSDEAEPGLYRLLMEGLESCVGRMTAAAAMDNDASYAMTPDGRRYLKYGSAQARRGHA